jgi:ubiquitin carboxyl-terminal hydrolase 5/13
MGRLRVLRCLAYPSQDHNEPPPKKLAIREEPSEEEEYEFFVSPRCFACGPGTDSGGVPIKDTSGVQLAQVVSRVMSSASSAQRSEVKAWEEEIIPCAHTTELVQVPKSDLGESPLALGWRDQPPTAWCYRTVCS